MKRRTVFAILFGALLVAGCAGQTPTTTEEGETDGASAPEAAEASFAQLRTMDDETLRSKFQPLGDMPIPEDNPMTDAKVELGKMLFADPRLSVNDQVSCMTCHNPSNGWSDGLPTSKGIDVVRRNAPTIINSGYYDVLFWDGRAGSLEEQAAGPLSDAKEMGNADLEAMVEEVKNIKGYQPYFDEAFDGEITLENILKAIGAFERTIVVNDTKYDRFMAGDDEAMTDEEKLGMELFVTKGCITCHAGPNFTDLNFHNIGMMGEDKGLMERTEKAEDEGKFRTPGLRGVAYTAPYMHDGSVATLEEVVDYYDRGGDGHPNTSELIQPLGLTDAEKQALVAFLHAISGEVPQVSFPALPEE